MNYTSIEQSKKLLELGLSPESADMRWTPCQDEYKKWFVAENKRIVLNYDKKHCVPCWSIGALLKLIPKHPKFNTALRIVDRETIIWAFECHAISEYEFSGSSDLECLYNAIVWMLENNYINLKK